MSNKITSCSKCGDTKFIVSEGQIWNASVVDGILECTNEETTGIDRIECANCGHDVTSLLSYENINWN